MFTDSKVEATGVFRALNWAANGSRVQHQASGRWVQFGYALTDLLIVTANAFVVFLLRYAPDWRLGSLYGFVGELRNVLALDQYLGSLLVYGALTVVFCQSQNLYSTPRTRSSLDETVAVGKAVALATLLLTAWLYLSKVDMSRIVVCASGVVNVFTLAGWRWWRRRVVVSRVAEGYGVRNVLIVGAGNAGQELARCLETNKHLGFVVKGFLDQNHSSDPRLLGRIEDLAQIARAHFADEVFITIPSERELVKSVALEARRRRLDVKVVPELYDGFAWRAPIEYLGDFPVMALHRAPIPVLGLLIKRVMDIACASAGLLLLSPLLAAIALAIKLDSPGPVLYRGLRVGKKGRRFVCCKFRTMVADADAHKDELRHLNERQGPFFKIANDPRLTKTGRFLRQYSLDELPQLWNVLRGEMSLVGPRPHPTDDCDQYSLEHLRRLDVTPGITGLWQVSARRDPSFEKNLALDLQYIEDWNLWLDVKILFRSVPAVLSGAGQ